MAEPATPFRFSLKRTKDQFNQSTTAFTSKSLLPQDSIPHPHLQATQRSSMGQSHAQNAKTSQKYVAKANKKRQESLGKMRGEYTQAYQQLNNGIQKLGIDNQYNLGKYKTRSYLRQHKSTLHISRNFEQPPPQVNQLYQRQLAKSADGNVHYQKGYLSYSGFMYYAVQDKLILVNVSSYFSLISEPTRQEKVIIYQLKYPALAVKQLPMCLIKKQGIQYHPFGQLDVVLIISHSWKITFHSLHRIPKLQIRSLDITYKMFSQAALIFQYDSNGDIYYLSQEGHLGRISFESSSLLCRKKVYPLQNYLFKTKNIAQRKRQNLLKNPSIWEFLTDQLHNIKYFVKTKKVKGIQMVIDRSRHLIYTLTQTTIRDPKSFQPPHRQISMYDISQRHNKKQTMTERLNSYINNYQPHLIKKILEQELYEQIGCQLFTYSSLSTFQIKSVEAIENTERMNKKQFMSSNLGILLGNGSRMYIYVDAKRMILNEIVNLPDLNTTLTMSKGKNWGNTTICQAQPPSLKLLAFILKDPTYGCIIQYCKKIITLLITRVAHHQETVQVIRVIDIESDGNRNSILNMADYMAFFLLQVGQLSCSFAKQFMKMGKHAKQRDYVFFNQIKYLPLYRQVFDYPTRFLVCQSKQPLIQGICPIRPIDMFLQILVQQANHNHKFDIFSMFPRIKQHFQIDIKQDEMVSMLVQIYCDPQGVYIRKRQIPHSKTIQQQQINCRDYIMQNFDDLSQSKMGNASMRSIISQICFNLADSMSMFQSAFLLYPIKILKSVWQIDVRYLPSSVCTFLHRLLTNFKQLLNLIRSAKAFMNEPQLGFDSLICKMLQLLSMLMKINLNMKIAQSSASLSLCEAVVAHPSQFSQSIFYSLLAHKNHRSQTLSSVLQQWQAQFPIYFTPSLLQSLRLVNQVTNMDYTQNQNLLRILQKKQSILSDYLLRYLYFTHKITQAELRTLMHKLQNQNVVKKVSHLIATQYSTPLQKMVYGLEQAEKHERNLQEKQFLLRYAGQNLDAINNIKESEVYRYKKSIAEKHKLLKMQKLLKKQVQEQLKDGQKIGKNTYFLLNYVLMNEGQLRSLLQQLESPTLLLVYSCIFGGFPGEIEECLRKLVFPDVGKATCISVADKLDKKVFEKCPYNFMATIPCNLIAKQLDTLAQQQVGDKNIFQLLKSDQYKQYFWVCLYLAKWGWSTLEIFDFYSKQAELSYKPSRTLTEQPNFIYYWANGYILVKEKYLDGRTIFTIKMRSVLQKNKQPQCQNMKTMIALLQQLRKGQ